MGSGGAVGSGRRPRVPVPEPSASSLPVLLFADLISSDPLGRGLALTRFVAKPQRLLDPRFPVQKLDCHLPVPPQVGCS